MAESLISAQVQFLDDRLALIHIPLDRYHLFLQPILQLLFHDAPSLDEIEKDGYYSKMDQDDDDSASATLRRPAFVNVSVTPVECSIACSRELANQYFVPVAETINRCQGVPDATSAEPQSTGRVLISKEDYIVMQVEGQGLDACRRVLDLTSPLAMAGISIFFISTYFSDYILVPARARGRVISALETRGFTFEATAGAFVSGSTSGDPSHRSSPPALEPTGATSPPPPSTISELQARTFELLRKHNVQAQVDRSLRIVQCAAHYREPSYSATPSILRPGVITALVLDKPKFLSLTLTSADPAASILLETRLLPRFLQADPLDPHGRSAGSSYGEENANLLIGAKDDVLVPIIFDLRDLPLEATGIICGVASRLAAATQSKGESKEEADRLAETHDEGEKAQYRLEADPTSQKEPVEMSFLSTTLGGTVIVGVPELERAMESLQAEAENAGMVA